MHKRRLTGGKKPQYHKKRKYDSKSLTSANDLADKFSISMEKGFKAIGDALQTKHDTTGASKTVAANLAQDVIEKLECKIKKIRRNEDDEEESV